MNSGTRLLRRCGMFVVAAAVALSPVLGPTATRVEAVGVVSSSPADGTDLPTSPAQVTVTFDQNIGSAFTMAIVCNGQPTQFTAPRVSDDLRTLIIDVAATPLPKGLCTTGWGVQGVNEAGTDHGSFSFKIDQDTVLTATPAGGGSANGVSATTTPGAAASSGTPSGSKLTGALGLFRLLSTIAIAALFGALVLITVAWPEGVEYILTIRFLRYAWIIAVAMTWLMIACIIDQGTGKSFTSSLSPTSWGPLKDSTPGLAILARFALVVAAGWVAVRPERVIDPTTQLAALALPGLAVATLGFSRPGGQLALVGYAAGVGHAIAMAVWFGGLVLLARVVLAGPGEDDLVHAVRGFGKLATPAMLLTVGTGAVQLYRLDRGHLLDTNHGRLLLLKVVPVVAMVFVGVATRQFVHARLARAESLSAPIAGRLRRAVGMEAMIGVVVLAITSWMLTTQPGNLAAGARSSNDFAYQQEFTDPSSKLDAKVSVNPARVGANEVLIEVRAPLTGISNFTVRFDPPVNAPVSPVVMTITEFPPGVTGWYLPLDVGIPLQAAGLWDVTFTLTSTAGTFQVSAPLSILPVGAVSDTVPAVREPVVTSPPASTIAPVAG